MTVVGSLQCPFVVVEAPLSSLVSGAFHDEVLDFVEHYLHIMEGLSLLTVVKIRL